MSDWSWAQEQLDKRGPGEKIVHAAPCKDSQGEKGWLVATDQRIWYFQKGVFAASEEYDYGASVDCKKAPFGLDKAMLCIDGEPFEMPIAMAEEFAGVIRRICSGGSPGQ